MPPRLTPDQIPPDPDLSFEQALWAVGLSAVAGLDEAGRGTWAGPVMAAAVILPDQADVCRSLRGVRDSKQLRPEVRSSLVPLIEECALAWAVGSASAAEIDEVGILPATRLSMVLGLITAFLGMTTMPSRTTQFFSLKSVPTGKGLTTVPSPIRAFLSMMAPSIEQFRPIPRPIVLAASDSPVS